MIKKITLEKIASFKQKAFLSTDKKVNLIYGLNGTGKSTISNYLYDSNKGENLDKYTECKIESDTDDHSILVYNQKFINENLYEVDQLKGIYTLNEKNKVAIQEIRDLESLRKSIEGKKKEKLPLKDELDKRKNESVEKLSENVWKIKENYANDNYLGYCLEKLKGSKLDLLNYLKSIDKQNNIIDISIEDLRNEIKSISDENKQEYSFLPSVSNIFMSIEDEKIFSKNIVGNENSSVSAFIKKFDNSDWVKEGLKYIPIESSDNEICPFCQEQTVSKFFVENIKLFFNESYEIDLKTLYGLLNDYKNAYNSLSDFSILESHPKLINYKTTFSSKVIALKRVLERNISLIEKKVKSPSIIIELKKSFEEVHSLSLLINTLNNEIAQHNNNINKENEVKAKVKIKFWQRMRFEYDFQISNHNDELKVLEESIKNISAEIQTYKDEMDSLADQIKKKQNTTINIEVAINNINSGLINLGITNFNLEKQDDFTYTIVREESKDRIFQSLSEGEKMMISFLYFLEVCKGKADPDEVIKKKIIVIDDPISSLSHIYVFNIGRFIHQEFLQSEIYEQIFILTHSLYFFYELVDRNQDRRNDNQKLFRLKKNTTGSLLVDMIYDEIQNDYHSYWSVIMDKEQHPALIANCMRNILEHFFNFVEKQDLNNVFQKTELKQNRFQAFNRYMQKESHSIGPTVFDLKEFDYDDFKDAFHLVFQETGYCDHYKKMMKANSKY